MNRGQLLTLLGGIGLILGAAFPWTVVTSLSLGLTTSKAGYEGDGIFTGIIGLVLVLIAILSKGKPGKLYSIVVIIFAILAGWILLSDLSGVVTYISTNISGDIDIDASVGVGIYFSLIGAVLALIGGFIRVPSPLAAPAPPNPQAAPSSTPGQ